MSDAPEFIYARPIGATVDWTGSTSGPWALDDPHKTATEYIRADRVRVTGFEDVPQWQTIDSAPRDGTKFAILRFTPDPVFVDSQWFADVCWFDDGILVNDSYEYDEPGSDRHPTHWMPLPKTPT